MFDWWYDIGDTVSGLADDAVGTVSDAVNIAWDWVNDTVDTYIWDTGEDEAYIEAWVNEQVDTYIWDAGEDEGYIEAWVNDIADTYVEPAVDWWNDLWDWGQDTTTTIVDEVEKTAAKVVEHIEDTIGDPDTGTISESESAVTTVIEYITQPEIVKEYIIEKGKEIALDPLGGILMGIVNQVAMRLELWFANALGISLTGESPEEKEE